MSIQDRRDFLRNTATAGVSLAVSGLFPRKIIGAESEIVYRQLGSTGYKVSEVGIGAMNTRDKELIHAAIDRGINYIDTAHGYQNGQNEEIIGEVMQTNRDKVFLTTKLSWRQPENMLSMMETSLERLKTDHVDLVLMHGPTERDVLLGDQYQEIFSTIKARGMSRFVGFSTHSTEPLVIEAAIDSKFWEALLITYNYMSPPEVTASLKKVREAGIAVIGMKNLLNPATRPRVPLEDIRKDKDGPMSASQALIKWVLDNNFIDTTIAGVTTFEHLDEDIALMKMKMTKNDYRTLFRYANAISPHYCRCLNGCTGCVMQCPKGVNIQEMNRCLMYADSYGDMNLAWENFREIPRFQRVDVCGDCDVCTVQCVNGLNLADNIQRVQKIFA